MTGRRTFLIGGGCTAFIKVRTINSVEQRDDINNSCIALRSRGRLDPLKMYAFTLAANLALT